LIQGLPFRRIPKAMIRAAIENANKMLNLFPVKNGASGSMSPLTIMTGKPIPDYNDMNIEFEAYAQVYEDINPTNTQKARTTGAIALTPTGNAQGGFYFLSLVTGRKLSRQQWDELPMPKGIIATVELMAQTENQPIVGDGAPLFEWKPGVAIQEEVPQNIVQAEGNEGIDVMEQDVQEEDVQVDEDNDIHDDDELIDLDEEQEIDEELINIDETTINDGVEDHRSDNDEELAEDDSEEETLTASELQQNEEQTT
jgi:hypothetical protein